MIGSGLCLGVGFGNPASPGWGLWWVRLGRVCGVAPLLPARVCGVCGWAWVSACTPPLLVRVVGRAWLCARSACTPPFPVLVCGVGVRAGVWVSAAPRHSLGRCWGVCVLVCPSRVVSCTSWLGMLCGCVWLGLGSCRPPLLLAGALGRVCVCVRAPPVARLSWLGCAVWACVLGSGFGCAAPFLVALLGCVCGRACARPAPALRGGPPVARGCAGVAVGGVCPPPSPLVLVFFFRGAGVSSLGFVVSVAGCPGLGSRGLYPPIPSRAALYFFFVPAWCVSACFGCSFSRWAAAAGLRVAGFGWLVPLCPSGGSCFRCRLARRLGRLLQCSWAVWWLWAVLAPAPLFVFRGGSACSFSAFPGLAHALVGIQCGLPGCCWWLRFGRPCPGPMGRVGYVHVGLGASSCRVRFWLCRLRGCARLLRVALG